MFNTFLYNEKPYNAESINIVTLSVHFPLNSAFVVTYFKKKEITPSFQTSVFVDAQYKRVKFFAVDIDSRLEFSARAYRSSDIRIIVVRSALNLHANYKLVKKCFVSVSIQSSLEYTIFRKKKRTAAVQLALTIRAFSKKRVNLNLASTFELATALEIQTRRIKKFNPVFAPQMSVTAVGENSRPAYLTLQRLDDGSGGYYYQPVGYKVSHPIDVSSVGIIKDSRISWVSEEPEGTSVIVELSYDDGKTWYKATSGQPFPGSFHELLRGKFIYRITLITTNPQVTPKFYELELLVSDIAVDDLWVDTSVVPNVWKRWTGSEWVKSSPTSAGEIGGLEEGKPYNGVVISEADGLVVIRTDDRVRTILNATDGIAIQTRPDPSSSWSTKLWADTFGNLRIAGTLEAATGSFSGTLQAAGGTFTGTLVGVDGDFTGKITTHELVATGTISAQNAVITGVLHGQGLILQQADIRNANIINANIQNATITGYLDGVSGTFTGTLIGARVASGSTIDVTTDARIGNNLYLGTRYDSASKNIYFYGILGEGVPDYQLGVISAYRFGTPFDNQVSLRLSAARIELESLTGGVKVYGPIDFFYGARFQNSNFVSFDVPTYLRSTTYIVGDTYFQPTGTPIFYSDTYFYGQIYNQYSNAARLKYNDSSYFYVSNTRASVYVNGAEKVFWSSLPRVRLDIDYDERGAGIPNEKSFSVNNPGSMQPILMDYIRVQGPSKVFLDERFKSFIGRYDVFVSGGALLEKAEDYFTVTGEGEIACLVVGVQKGKEDVLGYDLVDSPASLPEEGGFARAEKRLASASQPEEFIEADPGVKVSIERRGKHLIIPLAKGGAPNEH